MIPWQQLVMSVAYPVTDREITLGLKLVRIGKGLLNGFGGKKNHNESIDTTAARELLEESGLRAVTLEKHGLVLITNEQILTIIELHLYIVTEFEGELRGSDEMIPNQFPPNAIPYDRMWPNDAHTLPLMLAGKNVIGRFRYDANGQLDPSFIVETVDTLPDHLDPA